MDVLDFRLTPLRAYLPKPFFESVCKRANRVRYEGGQAIHARGDEASRLRVVASGAIRFGRFTPKGDFNFLLMLGPGAHFGDRAVFFKKTRAQNAYAVGVTEIDVFDQSVFDDLMKAPEFVRSLVRANAERLDFIMDLLDDARTLSVTERLAKIIWIHAGRGSLENGVVCLQSDLSDLLSVSHVAVGRALQRLERGGLITRGYRKILVTDKRKLAAWLRAAGAI